MNTTELINEIARRSQITRTRLTRQQVGLIIDLLLEVLADELSQPDGEIRLKQFGVFSVKAGKMPHGSLNVGKESVHRNPAGKLYYRVIFHPNRRLSAKIKQQLE